MNKNLFLGLFATSAMVFATSCSNDEVIEQGAGDMATVSFSIETEGATASRAISDGQTANVLYYRIFDENGAVISGQEFKTTPVVAGKATVNATLAKGKKYDIAFFAMNSVCEAYAVSNEMVVTVNYEGLNNDETRDAFFANLDDFVATPGVQKTVTLKRPFAQINVGANDYDEAVAAGVTISTSTVKISNAATTLNVLDGTVSGETNVVYSSAAKPSETLNAKGESYAWLSMCYVLPANDVNSTLVDAEFKFEGAGSNGIELNVNNAPIQRNYRTNILGKLLTNDAQYNVVIDANFENPDHNVEVWDGASVSASLSKDSEGNYLIKSAADFAYLMQKTQNVNSVFSGETFKLTTDINFADKAITGVGSPSANINFTFDGQGHTISNFSITTETAFYAGLFNQFNGTVKNLNVKSATVTGKKMAGVIASNVENGGVIENCHVEDCVIKATVKKAGVITGYTADGTVKDCSAKNCMVYCADPAETESGEIVGYVNTNSTIENNTATNVSVVRNCNNVEVVEVSSAAEFMSVGVVSGPVISAENKYIILKNDIDFSGVALKPLRLMGSSVFDGAGYKMLNVTAGNDAYSASIFEGQFAGNVVVKNVTIDGVVSKASKYASVLFGDLQNGANVTIDNVNIYNATVSDAETVGGFVGFLSQAGSNTLSIKNSSINNSTLKGIEEVGKIGAIVGRSVLPYSCSGVVVDNVKLYNNETLLTTVAEGTKSESKCTTGFTIK